MDTNYSIADFNLSVECMIDEIDDFMVEHPIFITSPNQTIANHISRAEALKLAFLDMTHGQTNMHYETMMLKLNSYIINAKKQIRAQQEVSNLRNLMEQTQDQRELISLLEQIEQLQTDQSNVSALQSRSLQICKTTPIPKIESNKDISSQLQSKLTSIQPIQTNIQADSSESIVSELNHSSPSARQSISFVTQFTRASKQSSSKHRKLVTSKNPEIICYHFVKKTSCDTRRKPSPRLHQPSWYYDPGLINSSVKCLLNPCQVLLAFLLGMLSLCFLDIFNLVLPFKHSKLPGLLNGNSILLFFEHSFMTFGHSSMVTWFQFHFIFIYFQF